MAIKQIRCKMLRIIGCMIMLCACGAFGQETAQQIVNRSAQAYGNQWTSGKIRDWTASGKIWINGQKELMDVTLMVKSNGKVERILHPVSGEDTIIGSDGRKSWIKIGPITAKAAGTTTHFIDSQTSRSIASLFNINTGLRDLGPSDKDRAPESQSSRVLEANLTRYYVDDSTSLIDRLEFDTGAVYTTFFSDAPRPVFASFVFSDYRNINGFIVPFNIKVYRGLVKIEEMTFTSVQSNTGIKDEQFTP
jgi:hypothetical protein